MSAKKKMLKKAALLLAVIGMVLTLAMALSSCITIKINAVKGSGQMATEEFDVSGFSRLTFSGIGKIILTQGESESLKITAEENIIDAMDIAVRGNTLNIGLKKNYINFVPTREILIYLSVVELEKIDLSGAGIIECDGLQTGNLSISSSGIG
ncbi:MAG: hypothetical protein FJW66_03035, partial [Actinobacteria bacterium]|nr:hypothetical protein [Actinomycetota bacterium]